MTSSNFGPIRRQHLSFRSVDPRLPVKGDQLTGSDPHVTRSIFRTGENPILGHRVQKFDFELGGRVIYQTTGKDERSLKLHVATAHEGVGRGH